MKIDLKNIPTVETIKRRTVKNMKELGTYKVQFSPIISRYAETVWQYNLLYRRFEQSDFVVEVATGASGVKKSPIVATLENLRKDLTTYEDRLLLNPKSLKDSDNKTDNEPSAFAKFLNSSGVD